MGFLYRAVFVMGFLLIPGFAFAQTADLRAEPVTSEATPALDTKTLHPAIQRFVDDGGTVNYLGNDHGLNAWVLEKNDNAQFAYTTPDGQAIISGLLFGQGDSEVITQTQVRRFRDLGADTVLSTYPRLSAPIAQTPVAKTQVFYDQIENANWFAIGAKTAKPFYIFVEPTCDHCHTYWQDLKPHVDNGTLQLRLIPVGWKEAALNTAAALLSAKDPQPLWEKIAAGQTPDVAAMSPEALTKARANVDLLKSLRVTRVPFSVYRNGGGKIMVISDKPDNLMRVLSDIVL